ncbi:flagellar filament capping protein FliD [Thiomicrorhabdus aquaedulcis]|uniref:flagellar filament capping protein FliD n=1 Tax=Thiomicrorhabdus aquaedulcis TaxID=2211106 RepID=UPI000FDBA78E|nr:flagellar filament capping protein FliD [Thiomicrorhabdus aquaedulcis]
MANEIGSTLLNSITNSTFDVGSMAKVLAEADVAGQRSIVERGTTRATTELDALKYLELNLQAFNSYVQDLSDPALFNEKKALSSNESVIKVTADETASLGSFSIESKQLAQAHNIITNSSYSSPYDTIASGSLTISVGGQVFEPIVIDAANNNLDALKRTINSGDYGVTASVINNAGSYQMMFTSKQTGAASEISLSGIAELESFTTTAQAQDAVMVLNGLTISNSSNTFNEVVEGVSFSLNSVAVGQTQSVNISQDPSKVTDAVKSFVDVYNQMDTILDELAKYDTFDLTPEQLESDQYKFYGDLAGNSTLREVRSNIKSALSGAIEEVSGNFNALSSIGMKFTLDGQLELDESILNSVASNNMEALGQLFAKGGTSSDGLVNVLSSSSKTQAGSYALNITQLATRATTDAMGVTLGTDEQVSLTRVTDNLAALSVGSGATFSLTLGDGSDPVNTKTLNITQGSYASLQDLATEMQTQIDTGFGVGMMAVSFDTAQSRFEIKAANLQGAVSLNSATGLDAQGFKTGNVYTGQKMLDLTAAESFDIKIDDSTTANISLASGRYTLEDLAYQLTNNINNNADIKASGNSVNIAANATGSNLVMTSNRYGGYSSLNITGATNASGINFGVVDTGTVKTGLSVDGTLTTASGTINIGAYADQKDGRKINISDYAFIGAEPAEVRGLSFEVLGGNLGARGEITFAQGFASRLEAMINGFFEKDTGLISRKTDSLSTKIDSYDERNKTLDLRYEKMEMKYRLQFSMLQSILSQSQSTRDSLTAQFSNNN